MKRASTLFILTLGHFIIDLACLYFYFAGFSHVSTVTIVSSALLYNFLAFALQSPIGYFFDKFPARCSTTIGILFIMGGYSLGLCRFLSAGLVFCGIGNAFYHVGGSIGIARTDAKGLRASGIFVASGALGVSLGTFLATCGVGFTKIILVFLIFLLILQPYVTTPDKCRPSCLPVKTNAALLILSLFAVFIRSLGALFFPVSYQELFSISDNLPLSIFLLAVSSGLIAFSGKFLGGFFSTFCASVLHRLIPEAAFDLRSCNYLFGTFTLLAGTLMLTFAGNIPLFCFLGMLCFHAAMPVTLFELYCIFPDRPGFAMGLSTVMLFLGYLPYVFSALVNVPKTLILFILSLAASVCMFFSYLLYRRAIKSTKGDSECN